MDKDPRTVDDNPWNQYSVRWKLGEKKGKTWLTALSSRDAKEAFNNSCKNEAADQTKFPFEAVATGAYPSKPQTNKQKLAGHYRWILGNFSSAEATFNRIKTTAILQSGANAVKLERAYLGAMANIAKAKRDIREAFLLAGIKIK